MRHHATLAAGLEGKRMPFQSIPVVDLAPLLAIAYQDDRCAKETRVTHKTAGVANRARCTRQDA